MDVLRVHPDDNVLVALRDLPPGADVACDGERYVLPAGVRAKHKVVSRALGPGDAVVMYGVMVGKASAAIARGMPATTENVADAAQDYGASSRARTWSPPDVTEWRDRHFLGYHRSDGQVGTANHWLVIPMVFCENRNVNVLAEAFRKELGYAQPDVYRRQVAELRAPPALVLSGNDRGDLVRFNDARGASESELQQGGSARKRAKLLGDQNTSLVGSESTQPAALTSREYDRPGLAGPVHGVSGEVAEFYLQWCSSGSTIREL